MVERRVASSHVVALVCLSVVAISCTGPTGPTRAGAGGPDDAGGDLASDSGGGARFIVVLADQVDPRAVAQAHGLKPIHVYEHVLNGFAGAVSTAARSGLLRDARVVSVERDFELRHQAQGSLQWDAPWGLDRIDQRDNALDGTYSYERMGAGVTVYIVDSGIRYSHTEFAGRARPGFDAFGGDGSDCSGHGTHVAGTVGGRTYGVAKGVDLVSVRMMNCQGWGSGSDLLAGIDWILANNDGPAVANMSFAFQTRNGPSPVGEEALQSLAVAGVTVVAAAANYNADACDYWPANSSWAITVGSTGRDDHRSSFSNWGRCVDWFAPGANIVSASFDSDAGHTSKSGTSMAAPHTVGVAALFLESAPQATPAEVEDALLSWTTRSVVVDAQSRNDHLLYSPAAEPGEPTNRAPSANFAFSCEALACQFSDRSGDVDGTLAAWNWSFGTGESSGLQSPAYTFPDTGTYLVALTVTDNEGAQGTTERNVTVTRDSAPNQPPSAVFSFTCESLDCQFTDGSSDPDGSVVAWSWTFDNLAQTARQHPSHTFPAAGTYEVALTVTDDHGASTTTARDVTVTEPAPPPPAGIVLTASGTKNMGLHQVTLLWSGTSTASVDIWRDGMLVASVPDTGRYLDALPGRGRAIYLYRVCEAGTRTCSAEVEVVF